MDRLKMLARLKSQTVDKNEKLRADVVDALKKNPSDMNAKEWEAVFRDFDQQEMAVEEYGLQWRKKGQQHLRYGFHEGVEVVVIKRLGTHTNDVKDVWQILVKGKAFLSPQHRIEDARRLGSAEFFRTR